MIKRILIVLIVLAVAVGAYVWYGLHNQNARLDVAQVQGDKPTIGAPETGIMPLVHTATPIGWQNGAMPTPAAGLKVQPFATGLDHPRWLLPLLNGDVLVAETNAPAKPDDNKGLKGWIQGLIQGQVGAGGKSANRITLLRDADGDGIAESRSVLIGGLNSPFGMALVGGTLYIADTDAVVKVPFTPGQTKIDAKPVKVVDLPAGPINHHWTKNVVASPDGKLLYVTIGSNSNVGDRGMKVEEGRAAVWEVNPATGAHRIYAFN